MTHRNRSKKNPRLIQRDAKIVKAAKSGMHRVEIAKAHGITKVRVSQILKAAECASAKLS